jgi:[ribosomal protein S5]-alanine N-acetyltransferase
MAEPAAPFRLPPAPPVLDDDAVRLRLLTTADVDLLLRGSHDPDVVRWTFVPPGLDHPAATALLQRWEAGSRDGRLRQYAIAAAPAPDVPVGLVSLILQDAADPDAVDVAYWLLPEGRGRGLVTRAVLLVLPWAFAAGCGRAVLHTMEGNLASEAVAQRCGFASAGRRTWHHGGRRFDLRRWERGPQAAPG